MRGHTPGPWVAESYNGKDWEIKSENMPSYRQIVPTCSDSVEAKVYVCTFKRSEYSSSRDYNEAGQKLLSETNAANARLIAAAPDMLVMLKASLYFAESVNQEGHYRFTQDLRDLIAKADGRS